MNLSPSGGAACGLHEVILAQGSELGDGPLTAFMVSALVRWHVALPYRLKARHGIH
jgi:hypothetical protein